MEAHCVNMELKYQKQALKDGQHGQIFNKTSNKAKIKKEIEVLETINIELEHSVAKLLAENEKLHKENEHLKQTYKDLYDSIKKTRVQTKDHNDSLIAQINSKTVENADLKAQIQEKVFANVALKNELRKLKGNSVDTNFAKSSILGKPVLQPPKQQSVVRQPNAFKFREFVLAKPHHVIAPGSSRNSSKESYGSNDMAHNYYLKEAKKKTQDKNRNLKPREMPSTRTHHSPNTCTPKPRSNNQTKGRGREGERKEKYGLFCVNLFRPILGGLGRKIAEVVAPEPAALTGSPSLTTIDQDAPSASNSQTSPETQSPVIYNDVEEENHDLDVAHMNNDPLFGIPIPENGFLKHLSSRRLYHHSHTAAPNSEHVTK
ncbi:hypothetical protein Tco_1294855 [Tanacetum coccineum]